MAFEILGDQLPADAKRAGRGGHLDQAAAFMRANAGKWIVVDQRSSEQAARNLAQALDKGGRSAFKIDDSSPDKGGRYEGGYRADGTVIGAFFPADWDETAEAAEYDDQQV